MVLGSNPSGPTIDHQLFTNFCVDRTKVTVRFMSGFSSRRLRTALVRPHLLECLTESFAFSAAPTYSPHFGVVFGSYWQLSPRSSDGRRRTCSSRPRSPTPGCACSCRRPTPSRPPPRCWPAAASPRSSPAHVRAPSHCQPACAPAVAESIRGAHPETPATETPGVALN